MAVPAYERILQEAERLSPQERLLLIERLAARLRAGDGSGHECPRWEQYASSAPYPLCGEDAQGWTTRTRRESDDRHGSP